MAKYRFNEGWLRSREARPDQRLEYADTMCPGLWLRVSGADRKVFSVMLRQDGKLCRRTLGSYPTWSLADARSEAMRLQTLAVEQKDTRGILCPRCLAAERAQMASTVVAPTTGPVLGGSTSMASTTFEEAAESYYQRHLRPNVRSAAGVRSTLRHASLANLQKRPVAEITKAEILSVLDTLMAAGTPQAALNMHRRLGMLFRWAWDRDLVHGNLFARIRPPAKTVERDRVLSDTEIAAVWIAAGQMPEPYCAFYRMLLLTGARRTEVAKMRWPEVQGDTWVIPRERVKMDRPHAIPLVRTALTTLAALPCYDGKGFAFSTTGGERPSTGYSKAKIQFDALCGVTDWRLHDLRRTVRSKLAELGVPREVARKILNHEDGKVDRIYNRYEYMAERRAALEAWERRLLSLVADHSMGPPKLPQG